MGNRCLFFFFRSLCHSAYVRIGFKCCETVSLPSKRSRIAGGSGRTADAAAYCSPYYGNGSFSSFFFAFLTIYIRLLVTQSSPRFCPTWPSVLHVPTIQQLLLLHPFPLHLCKHYELPPLLLLHLLPPLLLLHPLHPLLLLHPIPMHKHDRLPLAMVRCLFLQRKMFHHRLLSPLQMTFLHSTACGTTRALSGTIAPAWSSNTVQLLSFTGRMSIHPNREGLGNRVSGKGQRGSGLNGRYGIILISSSELPANALLTLGHCQEMA